MVRPLLLAAVLLGLTPAAARAQQIFETVGCRALGMAGAFVGVADDPSAVYWNPAGLASGGIAGATVEWANIRTGDPTLPPQAGSTDRSSKLMALGAWPVGLSYVRQARTALVAGAAPGTLNADTLQTSQFGLSLVQTTTQGVVVGATLKYLRSTIKSEAATGASTKDALDHGAGIDGKTGSAFDVDLGMMVDAQYVRFGVVLRNLRSPTFTDVAGNAITLKRQARAGLAVLVPTGLTLAMDVDLDTAALVDGPRRMFAVGAEQRIVSRLVVRGGTRWSLTGARLPVLAVGASVMLKRGAWIDGQMTRGGIAADRGFGIALRGAF